MSSCGTQNSPVSSPLRVKAKPFIPRGPDSSSHVRLAAATIPDTPWARSPSGICPPQELSVPAAASALQISRIPEPPLSFLCCFLRCASKHLPRCLLISLFSVSPHENVSSTRARAWFCSLPSPQKLEKVPVHIHRMREGQDQVRGCYFLPTVPQCPDTPTVRQEMHETQ